MKVIKPLDYGYEEIDSEGTLLNTKKYNFQSPSPYFNNGTFVILADDGSGLSFLNKMSGEQSSSVQEFIKME